MTIVTDNASNVIKTVEKLNEEKAYFESRGSCVNSDLDKDEYLKKTWMLLQTIS